MEASYVVLTMWLWMAGAVQEVDSFLLFKTPTQIYHRVLSSKKHRVRSTTGLAAAAGGTDIHYHCDTTNYGRGDQHLSASLDRGDVVVFQTGIWFVDGVEVGDGSSSSPSFQYGAVETIQIVWTHNCEHGVIRVWPLNVIEDVEDGQHYLAINDADECTEFGPEQLVAKLPLVWEDGVDRMQSPTTLYDEMWRTPSESD